jgi:hypothetical protein
MNPLTKLRVPLICDLKSAPYEYSVDASAYYHGWLMDHAFLVVPSVQVVANYLKTYKEFPPRQRPATFSIDQVIEQLEAGMKGNTSSLESLYILLNGRQV